MPRPFEGSPDRSARSCLFVVTADSQHPGGRNGWTLRQAINVIGTAFWEDRVRELTAPPIMRAIGDEALPWNRQLLPLLEQDGIILFVPSDDPNEKNIIPVYDALGGFLTANAVVTKRSPNELKAWLNETSVQGAFSGVSGNVHPLARNVFRSLVGLVPSRFPGNQMWQMLEGPLKSPALRMAAALEGRSLDAATVAALSGYLRSGSKGADGLFLRLFHMRGGPSI